MLYTVYCILQEWIIRLVCTGMYIHIMLIVYARKVEREITLAYLVNQIEPKKYKNEWNMSIMMFLYIMFTCYITYVNVYNVLYNVYSVWYNVYMYGYEFCLYFPLICHYIWAVWYVYKMKRLIVIRIDLKRPIFKVINE